MQTNRYWPATLAMVLLTGWVVLGCGAQADRAPDATPPEQSSSAVVDPAAVNPDESSGLPAQPIEPPDRPVPEVGQSVRQPEEVLAPDMSPPIGEGPEPKVVLMAPVPVPSQPAKAIPAPAPVVGEPARLEPNPIRMAPKATAVRPMPLVSGGAVERSDNVGGHPQIETPDEQPLSATPAEMVPAEKPADGAADGATEKRLASPEAGEDEQDCTAVRVFYGTDRAAIDLSKSGSGGLLDRYFLTLVAAGVTCLLLAGACFRMRSRVLWRLTAVGLTATVALGAWATYLQWNGKTADMGLGRVYGNQRGTLEYGTCTVTIPKEHSVGELESPSILRLEFSEDPTRHVMLREVKQQPVDEFFAGLKSCVDRSQRKETFVFVHGYNVTFEKAARRTAQLAYDLKFDGAPIFYSWPSQGGLLKYAVDETNVVWTAPHLKEFLVGVARRSGAKSIHLIAHSMGNRALTSALQALSYELRDQGPMFKEVVLTAPDIDAEVFRRDIAPAIQRTAGRVTLYASSNDEALAASKTVHGYPRAGESGRNIVVVPGIDTIDVSAVDTSLLGHNYYGSNDTVLSDLVQLLNEAKPPERRNRLYSKLLGSLKYWVFRGDKMSLVPARRSPQ